MANIYIILSTFMGNEIYSLVFLNNIESMKIDLRYFIVAL